MYRMLRRGRGAQRHCPCSERWRGRWLAALPGRGAVCRLAAMAVQEAARNRQSVSRRQKALLIIW